jgi:hypothetical protein
VTPGEGGGPGRRGWPTSSGADLIGRPPAWTVRLAGREPGAGAANVEGVAFAYGGHDLNLLAENRDVDFVPAAAYER